MTERDLTEKQIKEAKQTHTVFAWPVLETNTVKYTVEHQTSKGWEIICETNSSSTAFAFLRDLADEHTDARLTTENNPGHTGEPNAMCWCGVVHHREDDDRSAW